MLVLMLLEALLLNVPDLLRHVTRAERRADAAMDAAGMRVSACALMRAELDAAAGCGAGCADARGAGGAGALGSPECTAGSPGASSWSSPSERGAWPASTVAWTCG